MNMMKKLLDFLFHRRAPWFERYFVWLLVGGAVVAMALSLAIGLQQSVWFDEAYSIMLAKRPVGDLLYLTSIDTHPPLYYLLLKGWAGLFGWGEFALRSLSVLAMGGAVVLAGLFTKRFFGIRAALMTLPFLVLAPFLLRYGFEVRMYAPASLIGVAATYVLAIATGTNNKKTSWKLYLLYAVLVALGVYTLYYTALLWLVHVIWLIWLARHRKQSFLKQRWWLAYFGSVILFLPWLPTFAAQLGNGALAPIAQQMTIENLAGVVSFLFVYQPAWQLNALASLVITGVIAAIICLVSKAYYGVTAKQKTYFVLVLFYALLPILLIALICLAKPMYVERYLAHVIVGMVLMIGISVWAVSQKRPRLAYSLGGFLIAVMLLGIGQLAMAGNYNFQRLQVPQVAQAAQQLNCNDYIMAADPYVAIELAFYLPNCGIHFYSDTANLRGGYAPLANSTLHVDNTEKELAGKQNVKLVYYDEQKLTLPQGSEQTAESAFGPLHVASYRTP